MKSMKNSTIIWGISDNIFYIIEFNEWEFNYLSKIENCFNNRGYLKGECHDELFKHGFTYNSNVRIMNTVPPLGAIADHFTKVRLKSFFNPNRQKELEQILKNNKKQ